MSSRFPRTDFVPILFSIILQTAAIFAATAALSETRHALVVGIDSYQTINPLEKAVNDAKAVSASLASAGFDSDLVIDPTGEALIAALERLSARIQPGDEVVFFFAGHGVEIEGLNYLLPADITLPEGSGPLALRRQSLPVTEITDAFQSRGARVSLLILDACRDNPFDASGTRSLGGSRGLARMVAPEGTYIMYSAGAGQKALDSLGADDPNPNSVFTRALITRLSTPGIRLRDAVVEVRSEVRKLASSVGHNQFPAVYDQLDGDFQFIPAALRPVEAETVSTPIVPEPVTPTPDTVSMADTCTAAETVWAGLRSLEDSTAIQGFAKGFGTQCPDLAQQAHMRLAELKNGMLESCRSLSTNMTPRSGPASERRARFAQSVAAAKQACDPIVESFPDIPDAAYLAGRFLINAGEGYETLELDDPDPQRYQAALALFRAAADGGNTGAMSNIGWAYDHARGVAQDRVEAVRWYRMAAGAGDKVGMFNLGTAYDNGHGVAEDKAEALRWFLKSAEAGDTDAMFNVAWAYDNASGVEADPVEAFRWYRKAAEAGNVDAMFNVGWAYDTGTGVAQDFAEAFRWYQMAAEAGNAGGMYNVGWAYDNASGVERNPAEAARWYAMALESGLGLDRFSEWAKSFEPQTLRELQSILRAAGVYSGSVDGRFGPQTAAAFEAYVAR